MQDKASTRSFLQGEIGLQFQDDEVDLGRPKNSKNNKTKKPEQAPAAPAASHAYRMLT